MLSFRADARDEVVSARDRLTDYLAALIERKKQRPADDLLTALIAATEEDDKLSEDELLDSDTPCLVPAITRRPPRSSTRC